MSTYSFLSPARPLERALLSTLAYADIFDHPLRLEEIWRYFPSSISLEDLGILIEQSRPLLERVGDHYVLTGRGAIAQIRIRRRTASRRLWRRARPLMHVVAALPFVRMLAVTGSLATQGADEDADIDVFVVTSPGFLWVCRAMILLLARFARLRGTRICPNYLVTERALELPERSLYVARELTQMVPLSGFAIYDRMRMLNRWTDDYLPNARGSPASYMHLEGLAWVRSLQRLVEALLRFTPVRIVERYEMRRKIMKLQQEQGSSPEAFFAADVCKGHVDRHRFRIETRFEDRLADVDAVGSDIAVIVEGQP